jgi:excisionase family DNA binding protein
MVKRDSTRVRDLAGLQGLDLNEYIHSEYITLITLIFLVLRPVYHLSSWQEDKICVTIASLRADQIKEVEPAMVKSGPKYLNSDAAARMLGVNVSTIKRWTDSGKLECIRSAGGHRKFLMGHLADFAASQEKGGGHINILPLGTPEERETAYQIQRGAYELLIPRVEQLALRGAYGQIHDILSELYLARHPLYAIYDELVTPILHRIGELWAEGTINVTEEHVASQGIRDSLVRLQDIVPAPGEMNEIALCMNLSVELHDIAIKMVQHILEERGFQVLFSGQGTPAERMEEVLCTYQLRRIYISSTVIRDKHAMQQDLDRILQMCWHLRTRVFVGGAGFDHLETSVPFVERRLRTFREVAES